MEKNKKGIDEHNLQINLDINKGIPFSEKGKRDFYDKELSPIKAQILELGLISPDVSEFLMKEYNEFLKDIENTELSVELFRRILEFKERISRATERENEEKSVIVTTFKNKCQELLDGLSEVTLDQTEEEWRKLVEKLEDDKFKCTIEQKSKIQNILTTLHFFIIMEKVRANPDVDLTNEIQSTEKSEMISVIYTQLSSLLSGKENENVEELRTSVMLYSQSTKAEEMIFDRSIWEKFAKANGKNINKEKEKDESNLPAVIQKSKPSLIQRFRNIRRTEIEEVTDEVVTDEMLEEVAERIIREQNNGECDRQTLKRYLQVADRRLPVYEFIRKMDRYKSKETERTEFDFQYSGSSIEYHCDIESESTTVYCIISNNLKQRIEGTIDCYEELTWSRLAPFIFIKILNIGEFLGIQEEIKGTIIKNIIDYNSGHYRNFYKEKTIRPIIKKAEMLLGEYKRTQSEFFSREFEKVENARTQRQKFLGEYKADTLPIAIQEEVEGEPKTPDEIMERE